MKLVCPLIAGLLIACGPSERNPGGDGGGSCTTGQTQCAGQAYQTCQDGQFVTAETCDIACIEGFGCGICTPGEGTCNGDTSTACRLDGQGYFDEYCDPAMGLSCGASGICEGACSAFTLGSSYIGCEYYPTITGNGVMTTEEPTTTFDFAVVISNAGDASATVTIENGALSAPRTLTVAPGQVATEKLPWVPALKTCMGAQFETECGYPQSGGALVGRGAYRVRSTQPVTVYQFNPLDYTNIGSYFSFSNDASLLLPANVWKNDYVVAAWPSWIAGGGGLPSQFAITALADNTTVNFTLPVASDSFPAITPQIVVLSKGDVLQLMSYQGDLTGAKVSASAPIQVIGGHYCAQAPIGTPACDHLEESMFSIDALGKSYLVAAPYLPSLGARRAQMVRVIAAEAQTTLTFEPPVLPPTMLANAGDFVELPPADFNFQVSGDRKIMVAQYMIGQLFSPDTGQGDPAMALAVPAEQFRNDYLFHAPTNYESNWVSVIAPLGATVTVGGTVIDGALYTAIGSSGFGVADVQLQGSPSGDYRASSNVPFGISVYGYGAYTSYWYPGGLNLTSIPIE